MPLAAEILGLLGTALLLYGYILLGDRKLHGWVLQGLGDLCWIAAGVIALSPAIWASQVLFTLVHVRGFRNWRKSAAES